jgi:polar amino acid transport system permease protein/cystine transport system permease protein
LRVLTWPFPRLPTLTLLFVIYFGLPQFGIKLDSMTAGIVGLGLHGGAYVTEIFRAGIEAVHRGQLEGALSIGMTRLMALRLIILPQAARIVVPPLANFALVLLKDTSIASAVAAPELTFRAGNLIDQTHLSTQIYLLVALVYLAMGLALSRVSHLLERRLGAGHG